jgi:hypothetical protein
MGTPRLILFHKQSTSARTRFLRLGHGGICTFGPLPHTARLAEPASGAVTVHPASWLRATESSLALPAGSLEAEPGFRCTLRTAEGDTQVLLARFTAIDPPFSAAERLGGAFIDLTQARGLPPLELDLLRRAYEVILG